MLEDLAQEAARHQLADWDPERQVRLLRDQVLLGRLLPQQARDSDPWLQLCQLHPAVAEALGPPQGGP